MKFTLLLKDENASSEPLIVSEIERTGPLNAASLGMRCSPAGAHALLQVRAELVDGRLDAAFSRWYPGDPTI
jgi:hypothetical protein